MPIIKSAIKKQRQDIKSRKHNRDIRDAYKESSKKVRKLVEAGEIKKAHEALKEAYSTIDRAAKTNIIHKNNASRRKKRLAAIVKNEKVTKNAKRGAKISKPSAPEKATPEVEIKKVAKKKAVKEDTK